MSLLDIDLGFDSVVLSGEILKYLEVHTYLNMKINWNVAIDKDNVDDYILNPNKWYLYYTCNYGNYNIYIYSNECVRQRGFYVVTNKVHKPVNLSHILYESA